jgi:Cation transporting ATPase, C-terminus
MWRNIFVQAIYQLVASLALLFVGYKLFGVEKDSTRHYTIIFNAFVWMQLFNEVNSRKLDNEKNMFSGIHRNPMFLAVVTATIVVQILFVQVIFLSIVYLFSILFCFRLFIYFLFYLL